MNYKMLICFILLGGSNLFAAQMQYPSQEIENLMVAIHYNHVGYIKNSVDFGKLDPNSIVTGVKWTLLMVAAHYGKTEVVAYLLSLPTIKTYLLNEDGFNACRIAEQARHPECVRLIAAHKGLVENEEERWIRLLPGAIQTEKLVWIQSIFNLGFNPNLVIDDQGRTPLMIAAIHGKVDVVKFLLTLKGLNVLAKDISGFDAFDLATADCTQFILPVVEEQSKDICDDSFSDQEISDDSPPLAPRNNSQVPSCLTIRSADSTRN